MCVSSSALSPLQEGLVGIRHHFLLGLTDEVSLLFVRDGPTLLDLTQLLQTVVKALRGSERTARQIGCRISFMLRQRVSCLSSP